MKILIPTDFSESSRVAFDYAYSLFSTFENVEFVLLNSYEMPHSGAAGGVMMSLEDAMHKESKRDLSLEVRHFKSKYPEVVIESVSIFGEIGNSVSRINKKNNIDVVVMGTHGAKGFKKALLGSNTEDVIESSLVPVISVPSKTEYRPIKKIVYATDLQRIENPEALQPLCNIAKHFDAVIHIVYVTDDASSVSFEMETDQPTLKDIFKERKKEFHVVESDDVTLGISHYISEIDADLLVLLPKEASFWRKLTNNSVTEKMAFQAKVPMLTIKDKK